MSVATHIVFSTEQYLPILVIVIKAKDFIHISKSGFFKLFSENHILFANNILCVLVTIFSDYRMI